MKSHAPRQGWLFPSPVGRRAEISVIMPMDRPGDDAARAVLSVLSQQTDRPFELIVVAASGADLPEDERVRLVLFPERNPAVRRNRGAKVASGSILAFIDDDAFASPEWLENGASRIEEAEDIIAVGGPDRGPAYAPVGEQISDTLLATPLIGSGIAAHEARAERFEVRAPFDVALVNLFVSADAFREVGGFDESIGYIGEDTDLIKKLLERGRVVYDPAVIVRHRRRPFPGPYIRQRWRYRVKTGEAVAAGTAPSGTRKKALVLLAGGMSFLFLLALSPTIAAIVLLLYFAGVLALAIPVTPLPARWWWVIPPAFLLHHATYFCGVVTGIFRQLVKRA